MIISHRLKFAFFRVPKTGSTTAETMIRLSGVFDKDDILSAVAGLPRTLPDEMVESLTDELRSIITQTRQSLGHSPMSEENLERHVQLSLGSYVAHLTPKQAIESGLITLDQLLEYRTFAFLRDPFERDLSAYAHRVGVNVLPDVYKDMVKKNMLDGDILSLPSWKYFFVDEKQVLEPLDFDNYDDEIHRVCKTIGGTVFQEIPRLNPSRGRGQGTSKEEFYDEEVMPILEERLSTDLSFWRSFKEQDHD